MSLYNKPNNTFSLKEEVYVIYVEQCYRYLDSSYRTGSEDKPKSKLKGLFHRAKKVPVFRLTIVKNGVPSYEEYTTHEEIYNRISSERLVKSIRFPETLSINEFIDKGFKLRYTVS